MVVRVAMVHPIPERTGTAKTRATAANRNLPTVKRKTMAAMVRSEAEANVAAVRATVGCDPDVNDQKDRTRARIPQGPVKLRVPVEVLRNQGG